MDWIEFTIFFVGIFGLFIWNRIESRIQAKQTNAKLEALRALMNEVIQENKDFHVRICAIEERNRK